MSVISDRVIACIAEAEAARQAALSRQPVAHVDVPASDAEWTRDELARLTAMPLTLAACLSAPDRAAPGLLQLKIVTECVWQGAPVKCYATDTAGSVCRLEVFNVLLGHTPWAALNAFAPGQSIGLLNPTVTADDGTCEIRVVCRDPCQVQLPEHGRKRCWSLGCDAAGTLCCTKCRLINYCCVDHQRVDWPFHKQVCVRHRVVATAPVAVQLALEMAGAIKPAELFAFTDARIEVRSSPVGGVGVFSKSTIPRGTILLVRAFDSVLSACISAAHDCMACAGCVRRSRRRYSRNQKVDNTSTHWWLGSPSLIRCTTPAF
jgi:hypothetical protein